MSQTPWHAVRVWITRPEAPHVQRCWVDGIAGRTRDEAMAAARANWISNTPATPASRIDYLGPWEEVEHA